MDTLEPSENWAAFAALIDPQRVFSSIRAPVIRY